MAGEHAMAYSKNPAFELAGVLDIHRENAHNFSQKMQNIPVFDDFEEALLTSNPGAICICSWADSHFFYAKKGLEAGLHIFVEKPPALSVNNYRELVKLAVEKSRVLMGGFILHWHPAYDYWISNCRKFTESAQLKINFMQHSQGKKWESQLRQLNFCSVLLDAGIHYVDVILQMAQCLPEFIDCRAQNLAPQNHGFPNVYELDLYFPNNFRASLNLGWGPYFPPRGIHHKQFFSQKAHFNLEYLNPNQQVVTGKADGVPSFQEFNMSRLELCALQAQKFAEAIEKNLSMDRQHQRGLNAMEILERAEESRVQGQKLSFLSNFSGNGHTRARVGELQELHSGQL